VIDPARRPWRAALIALVLAYLAACAEPGKSTSLQASAPATATGPGPGSRVIHVVRRKWHIDVGFAVADLTPPLAQVARRFPGATYLFFGFGDRHYLLAKHRGTSDMLGALWPGPALILVTAIANTPEQAFGASQAIELRVTADQERAAQALISRSMGGEDAPRIEPYAPGPYDDSLYFAATERYSAAHTCNSWAAEVLRAAGLPVSSRLVFAGQLWRQIRRLEGVPARGTPLGSSLSRGPSRFEHPDSAFAQSQGGGFPF
jgi:hypothetical protein